MRWMCAILVALSVACPAIAQQARAPAGGTYVNGQFYAGGQFLPRGANGFGGGMIGMPGPAFDPTEFMNSLPRQRRTARRAPRSSYRGQDSDPADQAVDEDARAKSSITVAKNLVRLGKYDDARTWLEKAAKSGASETTVQEARKALADIGRRTGRVTPRVAPQPARAVAAVGNSRSGSVPSAVALVGYPPGETISSPTQHVSNGATVAPSPPKGKRYFAQIAASGRIRVQHLPDSLGVLESRESVKPIGRASESGASADGTAEWSLIVNGADLPGKFVIVDREFVAIKN